MTDEERDQDDIAVTVISIDYTPGTQDPGRVFRSMAALIEAFQSIDRDLAKAVSATVDPEVYLERVEVGSIRAVLRTVLRQVDDEALKNLDWKPLVGQYLVRGKQILLGWLDGKPTIESRGEILGLRQALLAAAPDSVEALQLPAQPIPVARLLEDLRALSEGVAPLLPTDAADFEVGGETSRIETRFRISSEEIETLLTEQTLESTAEMVLLVKKPDYLGRSRWEFKLGEQAIEAKMLDEAWLELFRTGTIILKPGYALRATVKSEMAMGFEGAVVGTRYEVLRVLGVITPDALTQARLPSDDEAV
jgi:hypothetical protein